MRLESALFTSRSGLTAQGQAISIVGDNISNANTVGYRRTRAEFSDIVAASKESVSGGSGVAVTKARTIQETGVIEATGRVLDLGIGGEGFFIVNDGERDLYTRAGNFNFDTEGYLIDADNNRVQGYLPGASALSAINLLNVSGGGVETSAIALTGNLSSNETITPLPATAPESFDDLTQAANFTHVMDTVDSLGTTHTVYVAMFKTATNTWTAQAYMDGADLGGTAGQPVKIGTDATLSFSSAGAIDAANKGQAVITASAVPYSNGAAAGNFTVDMGGFAQFATASIVNSVTNNGQSAGDVRGYEIGSDGKIYAQLSSGGVQLLGTIALADFPNLDGLERVGRSTFVANTEAGTRIDGTPGLGTFGRVDSGSLERSTVDIADQFVDLVLFQRAYQASSQTLNAANTLIRDTLSLIR